MNVAGALRQALGYFTIVPAGDAAAPSPDAVALLPLVGIAIGASSGAIAAGIAARGPAPLARGLAVTLPIVFSGALHVDGFLDVCDALFAQVSPERRREILRDPAHGSFALAGQTVVAILAYASAASVAPRSWPVALAFAEGTARLAAVLAARDAANAPGTAAGAFAEAPPAIPLALQALALTGLAFFHGGPRLALAGAGLVCGARMGARSIARAFGGTLNGDAYGFLIVTGHVTALACAAALRRT